jgi:hypothetical protein
MFHPTLFLFSLSTHRLARTKCRWPYDPPKWGHRSCIGVCFGHSSFCAGSVALVFNPCTECVLPQHHVDFDETFSTIPFMDASKVPYHWADLHKYSTKKSTGKDFNLTEVWMKEMPDHVDVPAAGGPLTDSFTLIPDQIKAQTLASDKINGALVRDTSPSQVILPAFKGANKRTLASASSSKSTAAPSSTKAHKLDTHNVVQICLSNDFNSPALVEYPSSQLTLSPRINLYEAGLCRLPCLLKFAQKATHSEKAHVIWSKSLPKLVSPSTLFCLISDFVLELPSHKISSTASFTNQMANCLHKIDI